MVSKYKTLKISIGAVVKNSGMLRFVPDHLKIKKMCKNGVEKLPFVIKYVPDKVILKNGKLLGFIPDCYKYKKKRVLIILL